MIYVCIPTTKERRERLAKCVASIHENAGTPHAIITYENYREGFVGPIHKILEGLRDDALVWCIGDDTILTEPDTLKRLEETFRSIYPDGDGVVNPDDGIQRGAIITMPLCTALTMRRYTYKEYFLNCADNEFTMIMKDRGKYTYVPSVQVEHQHHIVGKAKKDETYSYALSLYPADTELFHKRKARGFLPRNDI